MARYTSGMTNPVSIVIRSEGKKGAFVFGGPKHFRLYAAGLGPARKAPPGENLVEYLGTLESLDKQFNEARQDNVLSQADHSLLMEALRRARQISK